MTSLCLCCGTELQARKVGLYIEPEIPADLSIIVDQEIRSILRLMVGDSVDFDGKILLR